MTCFSPVLHLAATPVVALLDAAGVPQRLLAHRREFTEHPASADDTQPRTGQVRRWQEGANLQGAWVWMETVPSQATLHALTIELAHRGAVGILLPQQPTSDGYLGKRVAAASPAALPIMAVRADLLPTLESQHLHAHMPIQRLSARGQQIIGHVVGTNSALANSPVIVGAHYDGVGDDPGGARLPGAADNATGVAERHLPAPADLLCRLRRRGSPGAGLAGLCAASANTGYLATGDQS